MTAKVAQTPTEGQTPGQTPRQTPEQAPRRAAAWPFPHARKVGTTVYVGLQVMPPAAAPGEGAAIEDHTHHAFRSLIAALESKGLKMSDLMKLHTYYPYEGDGAGVTKYWERMTAVRLQYLADPGPAATALRVEGMWPGGPQGGTLIGVDGIGEGSSERKRIMPEHAWDWSIPTPFSQGWLVKDKVYVGGQISADKRGKAVSPGEVVPQTRNTLEFIRHVLLDAGASWNDVVSIKVAYKCTKDDGESRDRLRQILQEMNSVFPATKPALVTFGVDLLYEGLLLEIDALAVKGREKTPISIPGSTAWSAGYPSAWLAGNEVVIGGQSAPDAGALVAQARSTMNRIGNILEQAGSDYGDLVKINVYYCSSGSGMEVAGDAQAIADVLEDFLQPGRTVVSIVQVPGLMHPGQKVQIDGIAVLNQE